MSRQWSIYRKEALVARRERLAGEVIIVQPLSLRLLVSAFALLLVAGVATLWKTPITRSVQAVGEFEPTAEGAIALIVRAQDAHRLSPGNPLMLHASGSASALGARALAVHGYVSEIATTPSAPDALGLRAFGPTNTVQVSARTSTPPSTELTTGLVTATIVTERTNALHWLVTAASKGTNQ